MAYKRNIDRLLIPPKDAKVQTLEESGLNGDTEPFRSSTNNL